MSSLSVMAHRIHVRPLSLAALSALFCVIADISTSAARYGPKVSAARRWSAHLVAVDVRGAPYSGSSPVPQQNTVAVEAGGRASALPVKSPVRDGRLGLCGVGCVALQG